MGIVTIKEGRVDAAYYFNKHITFISSSILQHITFISVKLFLEIEVK